jgi:hypothetical protein
MASMVIISNVASIAKRRKAKSSKNKYREKRHQQRNGISIWRQRSKENGAAMAAAIAKKLAKCEEIEAKRKKIMAAYGVIVS